MIRVFIALAVVGAAAFQTLAQAPVNDLCTNAIPVFNGVNPNPPFGISGSFFTNVGAGTDATPACPLVTNSVSDVWFSYTATGTGVALLTICRPATPFQLGSMTSAALTVYASCGGAELACMVSSNNCVGGSAGVSMIAGTTYIVRVAARYTGALYTGTFYLMVTPPAPPPPNDLCASATPVFDGVNPGAPAGVSGMRFTNVGAVTEGTASCDTSPSTSDVWFSYTATASGVVVLRTCTPAGFAVGSGDMSVSVLTSCGGPEIACRTNMMSAAACSTMSIFVPQTAFVATAGSTYIIRVASWGGYYASFHLTIIPPGPPPANDSCANALPVQSGTSGPYTNAGATQDGTASCTAAAPSLIHDVWFTYTATASGTTTFGTSSLSVATQIAIFTGCGGTELACAYGQQSVALAVVAGKTYLIRVDTYDTYANLYGYTASFYLTVSAPAPPPPNDECTGAIPLTPGIVNGPFSYSTATTSAGGSAPSVDVWYSFTTSACAGSYTIDACPYGLYGFLFYAACGGPVLGFGYQDPQLMCVGVRGTFFAAAFTTYFIRVMGPPGPTGPYTLTIASPTTGGQQFVTFSSPFGPTSIQANLSGLPFNGLYFFPVATKYWAYPAPNFYGLNMSFAQAVTEFNIGPPFTGSLDGCGNAQIGPFSGVPSGTTIYVASMGFAAGYTGPITTNYYTWTYTVP